MTDRACQRPGCDNLIPSRRRRDARWCSRKCEGRATRVAKRMGIGLADYGKDISYSPVEDQSLTEMHQRARPPQHRVGDPRQFSDFGLLPGDAELAAEFDDEHLDDEHDSPRETWRRWRAHGRRHGTEHPEQTADRIMGHRAAEAARMVRIDRSTAGRPQDRFDTRTTANVGRNAQESRRLNVAHVDRPPSTGPHFDFTSQSFDRGPFRQGRPSGQRSQHSDFAWNMTDGFVY